MTVVLTEAYNRYGPTFISAMQLYLRWRLSRARLQPWQSSPTCSAAGAAVSVLQCPPSAAVAHAGLHVEKCSRWAVGYSVEMPEQQGTCFFQVSILLIPHLGHVLRRKAAIPIPTSPSGLLHLPFVMCVLALGNQLQVGTNEDPLMLICLKCVKYKKSSRAVYLINSVLNKEAD